MRLVVILPLVVCRCTGLMIRAEEEERAAAKTTAPLDALAQRVHENHRSINQNAQSLATLLADRQSSRGGQSRVAELADEMDGLREAVSDLEADRRMQEQWIKDRFVAPSSEE